MDREELCESLITWMQTFEISVPVHTVEDLSDGVAMAQVLNQIVPDYFNEGWMSKIRLDEVTNWRLKVSNLKKILNGILEYNMEVLGIHIQNFQMPDVSRIGERSDVAELGRLLQLILGCAVNCANKEEYIGRIMSMEESVQHVVMNAIQELMTKEMSANIEGDTELGDQLKRAVDDLNSALEAKEELTQRCHELDQQVAALLEEKQVYAAENDRLQERINQSENFDDSSTPAGKRFLQLQQQVDALQEENFKLETSKDDIRIKFDVLSKECTDLKQKNAELTKEVNDARTLKDEVDVLRHTSEQVTKYEGMIDSYKKKIEELSDLRGQVKLLEEKNTKYMQDHLDMEEELRKSSTVKQQLEMYKRQVHELQSKMSEETKRADKADFECKRAQEKLVALQREKERIATERDSLKEMNEELKCSQLQSVESGEPSDLTQTPRVEMLSLPPEIKEKILRLEHENKMLRLKGSGSEEEGSQVLQSMLDDANSRKNELETELRISNQRIMELEAQVEDIHENQNTVTSEEVVEVKRKLNEQIQRTQEKDSALSKTKELQEELEKKYTAQSQTVQQLQDLLNKKDNEMKLMEARYSKYLDKARAVFKAIDPKQNSSTSAEVQALKNQLHEKEKYIAQIEKENEKSKSIRDQEEKYIVSAWYNIGMQLNRQAAEERLNTQGQSFLAKQRQVRTSHRTQTIPNSNSQSDFLEYSV
ncbi:protein Hook homolog 3-like isoform X1 [Ostrea edulis]|uniref:protein Hook homolog 3-like isoform X1 n=1 Tax=Ostrea edulis TaxID=37623 RepID=UPI0024AF3518|nr:protein Hook homolog 3-like isoform X1 [Ostrea edulis]